MKKILLVSSILIMGIGLCLTSCRDPSIDPSIANIEEAIKEELTTNKAVSVNKTLVLVHGFNANSGIFNGFLSNSFDNNPKNGINDFSDYYGTTSKSIVKVDYYGANTSINEFKDVNINTSIGLVGYKLMLYLLRLKNENKIYDHIDIAAHSMGGLVVRYMIKYYYTKIRDMGIIIDHIATIATPNHGTTFATILGIAANSAQIREMMYGSGFTTIILNIFSETPYNRNNPSYYNTIKWSTFRGRILSWYDWLCLSDGVVDHVSVPLIGAANYGIYENTQHDAMLSSHHVLSNLLQNEFQN